MGTIIAGAKNSYAVMLDETTGKQGMYKLGESINEATVIKICKESIIVEKDGRSYDLKITGGASPEILSGNMPPSTGVPKELPYFEPVFNQTGPAADEDVAAELPHFEPITNNTGPQVDDGGTHKELPEFEPIKSDSGPPG